MADLRSNLALGRYETSVLLIKWGLPSLIRRESLCLAEGIFLLGGRGVQGVNMLMMFFHVYKMK